MSQGLVMETEATPWGLGEGARRQARLWKTRLQIKPETWKGDADEQMWGPEWEQGPVRPDSGGLEGPSSSGAGRGVVWPYCTSFRSLLTCCHPFVPRSLDSSLLPGEGGSLQAQPSSSYPASAHHQSPIPPPLASDEAGSELPLQYGFHTGPPYTEAQDSDNHCRLHVIALDQ